MTALASRTGSRGLCGLVSTPTSRSSCPQQVHKGAMSIHRGLVSGRRAKQAARQWRGVVTASMPTLEPRTDVLEGVPRARPVLPQRDLGLNITTTSPTAYELLQGPLVRYCDTAAGCQPPTAVLVHGILGSRKNLQSFAARILQGFPSWQVLLVDLRCHGESARLPASQRGPHGVESSAGDILQLLSTLKLFPQVLVGHSFGGKVVMSMADQFGRRTRRLPRPVRVWVLDALPGAVRAAGPSDRDHPAHLIRHLRQVPMPLESRTKLYESLERGGFSPHIARWVGTNIRPAAGSGHLGWTFDLDGITEMYRSYETASLWPFLQAPAEGIQVHFVKAEHSTFRWGGPEESLITAHGHQVHLLRHAGHWVHSDNPEGLFEIMAPSFGAVDARVA